MLSNNFRYPNCPQLHLQSLAAEIIYFHCRRSHDILAIHKNNLAPKRSKKVHYEGV